MDTIPFRKLFGDTHRHPPSLGIISALMVLFLALGLAPSARADSPPPQQEVFTAAVVRDFPPLYQSTLSGEPSGFSIDIAREVARLGGFTIRYLPVENWSAAMEAVRTGKADFIPGIGITPGRSQEFAFSIPMETVPVTIFVRDSTTAIGSTADLANRRVAVLGESAAKELLARTKAVPVSYPNLDSAAFALLAGDVDAYIAPRPVLLEKLKRIGLSEAVRGLEPPFAELKRGWLMRKDQLELLARIDPLLTRVVLSAEYAQAYARAYGKQPEFWTIRRVAFGAAIAFTALLIAAFVMRNRTLTRLNDKLLRIMDEREEAEEALREQEQVLRTMLDHLSTGIMVVDPATRKIERINPSAAAMIGLTRDEIVGRPCLDFICPGGAGLCPILDEGLAMDNSERSLLSVDGRTLTILKTVTPIRLGGKDYLLESFVDVTRLKAAEENLRSSLTEKDVLLREVHHRVKNNMQIISSLLSLQESASTDRESHEELTKSRQRIRAMALVHETLYRSGHLSAIDAGAYLSVIAQSLVAAYSVPGKTITFETDLPTLSITPDQAISCGLLVNELLTNCLRHAFEGRDKGRVKLTLAREEHLIRVTVEDDGTGLPEELGEARGLGIQLARSLVDQLSGEMRMKIENGTRVDVIFPA